MKLLAAALLFSVLAAADSNPTWWNYASPDATALVGIQWENLRQSPLAGALSDELSGSGELGLPNLESLQHARQFVISAPDLLAMASGTFPPAQLKAEAQHAGLHPIKYRGVAMWLPAKSSDLGVAQISEQLLLVGSLKTLESAIENSLAGNARRYSPLLAHAARFSTNSDLWVVSSQLPDPLANRFVPLQAAAQAFEGGISLRSGLDVEAWMEADSASAATGLAKSIRKLSASLPAFGQGLQINESGTQVTVSLQATPEELSAALQPEPQVATAQPVQPPQRTPAPPARPPSVPVVAKAEPAEAPAPPAPAAAPAAPPKPQVIRIFGLDDGPREIPFPPAQ